MTAGFYWGCPLCGASTTDPSVAACLHDTTRKAEGRDRILAAQDAISATGTYLFLEMDEGDRLYYSTRDHGDVGEETPGQADVDEARRVKRAIAAVPGVRVGIETIDEWVGLEVTLA